MLKIHRYNNNNNNTLTNPMEPSPSWKANSCLGSQEIVIIYWNPKFHYRVYKSTTLDPSPEADKSSSHPTTIFP
jgi:hypothetical protein